MKFNTGYVDRIIRIIFALTIGILYFTEVITGTLGIVLIIVAAIMFLTGVIGVCPAYCLFKIQTKSKKN